MHEAALAAPLLRLVLEEVALYESQQGQELQVSRVRVRAGLLMGIEAPTMQGIFSLMAEGTAAEGAELVIEPEPMTGNCPECGAHGFSTFTRKFHCPACEGEQADWKGGNELYIASIDVVAARGTPDADTV